MIDFVKKHVKKIAAGAGVMTIAAVFVVTNLTTHMQFMQTERKYTIHMW